MNGYTETLGSRDQDKTDISMILSSKMNGYTETLGSRVTDQTDISMITFFQNEMDILKH